MRMDKLTSRFQQSLADAQSLALGRDHQFLEPAHLMLALLDGAGGSVRPLLLKAGADVNKLRAGLLALLDGLPKVEGTPGDIHVSNDLNRVLNVTDKLAQQRGDQFISSELFVLAAFEDRALARPRPEIRPLANSSLPFQQSPDSRPAKKKKAKIPSSLLWLDYLRLQQR